MSRRIGSVLSLLVLLVTGALGVYHGVDDLSDVTTPFQYSVTIGVILYGLLGLAAGTLLALRHRWSVPVAVAWAVVVTFVASTAALAYAGEDATVLGAVFGGIGSALVGAAVVWGARIGVRLGAPG